MSQRPMQTIPLINSLQGVAYIDPAAALLVAEPDELSPNPTVSPNIFDVKTMRHLAIQVMALKRLGDDASPEDYRHLRDFARACVAVNPMALLGAEGRFGNAAFGLSHTPTRSAIGMGEIDKDQMSVLSLDAIKEAIHGDGDEQSEALAQCAPHAFYVRSMLDMMAAFPVRNEASVQILPPGDNTGLALFGGMNEDIPRYSGEPIVSGCGYLYGGKRIDFQATVQGVKTLLQESVEDDAPYDFDKIDWDRLSDQWNDSVEPYRQSRQSVDVHGLGERLRKTVSKILADASDPELIWLEREGFISDAVDRAQPEIQAVLDQWNAEIREARPLAIGPDTNTVFVTDEMAHCTTPREIMAHVRQNVRSNLESIDSICASVGLNADSFPFYAKAANMLQSLEFGAGLPDVRLIVAGSPEERSALRDHDIPVASSLQEVIQEIPEGAESNRPVGVDGKDEGLVHFLMRNLPNQTVLLGNIGGIPEIDRLVNDEKTRTKYDPVPDVIVPAPVAPSVASAKTAGPAM